MNTAIRPSSTARGAKFAGRALGRVSHTGNGWSVRRASVFTFAAPAASATALKLRHRIVDHPLLLACPPASLHPVAVHRTGASTGVHSGRCVDRHICASTRLFYLRRTVTAIDCQQRSMQAPAQIRRPRPPAAGRPCRAARSARGRRQARPQWDAASRGTAPAPGVPPTGARFHLTSCPVLTCRVSEHEFVDEKLAT